VEVDIDCLLAAAETQTNEQQGVYLCFHAFLKFDFECY
jgi:hypothetical protein